MGKGEVSEMAFHSGNTVKKQGRGAWNCHLGRKGALLGKGWKLENNCWNQKVYYSGERGGNRDIWYLYLNVVDCGKWTICRKEKGQGRVVKYPSGIIKYCSQTFCQLTRERNNDTLKQKVSNAHSDTVRFIDITTRHTIEIVNTTKMVSTIWNYNKLEK